MSPPTAPLAAADVQCSAALIRQRAGARQPRIAVLLGSGWGGLAERLADAVAINYAELPAFPTLGVGGHAGQLLLGRIGAHDVAVLAGRKHAYETGDAGAMKGAIATLAALGVQVLVQTNAAGSLVPAMRPGSLMLLEDHLNLVQTSPLLNEPGTRRFLDLRDAYCPALRAQALAVQPGLQRGVYAWMLGPQFETPAEIRMLQALGAHAVGMSTVPETILARFFGLRVLALSLVTNMACGMESAALSHEHTLAAAQQAGSQAVAALASIVAALQLNDTTTTPLP
jgi:purine-nucleoside phosphorylase